MEPVLTYRKGEGWIYENPTTRILKDKYGREWRVWFERRDPEIGECGWNVPGSRNPGHSNEEVFERLSISFNYESSGKFGWLHDGWRRLTSFEGIVTVFSELV